VDCLEVQHGNRYGPWLYAELERRAAYACVEDVADFRSTVRAVTRAGQIKDTDRHEKDDRRRVDDRRSYVLGWSNQAKVDALLEEEGPLARRVSGLLAAIDEGKKRLEGAEARLRVLSALAEYQQAGDLDWAAVVGQVHEREAELKAIRASSDILRTLTAQREAALSALAQAQNRVAEIQHAVGRVDGAREQATKTLSELDALLGEPSALEAARPWFAVIAEHAAEPLATAHTASQVDRLASTLTQHWSSRIEHQTSRQHTCEQRVVRKMTEFRTTYPAGASPAGRRRNWPTPSLRRRWPTNSGWTGVPGSRGRSALW
jgi:uncharacterized protein YPO0396